MKREMLLRKPFVPITEEREIWLWIKEEAEQHAAEEDRIKRDKEEWEAKCRLSEEQAKMEED
jgi:hypothetical protein